MGIKATNNRIFEERDEVNISFLENVINYSDSIGESVPL